MAIAVIKKATIIVPRSRRQVLLRLLQAFQGLELMDSPKAGDERGLLDGVQQEKIRDALDRIHRAQQILNGYVKANTLEKMRKGRPQLTMEQLENAAGSENWEQAADAAEGTMGQLEDTRRQRAEIFTLIQSWRPWQALDGHPGTLVRGLTHAAGMIGTVPEKQLVHFDREYAEATAGCGYREEIFRSGDEAGLILLFPGTLKEQVDRLARQYDFAACDFPYEQPPAVMLEQWARQEQALMERERTLLQDLAALAEKKPVLDLAEEFYQTLLLRDEADRRLVDSRSTVMVQGWLDAADTGKLEARLKKQLDCPFYLGFADVEKGEAADTPILLKNNKVVSAFETLTEMYSMPAYDEVDPTPVMTPFYLAFFGMMVADIGYGLVMLLVTGLAKLLLKPDRGMKKSINFFYYLSYPVILWGIIYGSFFGVSMPFTLLSPTQDIIPILIISIVLGWIQLMTGLGMQVHISLKRQDVLGALSGGVAWMLLLGGLALLVVAQLVLHNRILLWIAVVMCLVAALGIVVLPVIESRGHRIKGLLKGLYALYGATGYVGDLVSYTRLMALGVAGGSIAVAFNTIINSLPMAARVTVGVLLAVALHALNMFLSLLGAYVHGIRLQYVEFFGKFYSGGGRKFAPFKTAEKHIYLVDDEKAIQPKKTEESR